MVLPLSVSHITFENPKTVKPKPQTMQVQMSSGHCSLRHRHTDVNDGGALDYVAPKTLVFKKIFKRLYSEPQ
jgi:hypothetical protein